MYRGNSVTTISSEKYSTLCIPSILFSPLSYILITNAYEVGSITCSVPIYESLGGESLSTFPNGQ